MGVLELDDVLGSGEHSFADWFALSLALLLARLAAGSPSTSTPWYSPNAGPPPFGAGGNVGPGTEIVNTVWNGPAPYNPNAGTN